MSRQEKKTVLHIHTLPVISGSGINTFLSMQKVDSQRYISMLACAPGGALEDRVREKGFVFFPVSHFVGPVNLVKDVKALFEVYRILKKNKVDIVHTHNSKAGFIGRLAATLAGIPKIVHTVHGYSFHNAESFFKRVLFIILERVAVYCCHELIFISRPMIAWAKQYGLYKQGHSSLIYSGIELAAFDRPVDRLAVRRELGIAADAFVIGQVSKLWEGKGHQVIIDAACRVRDKIPGVQVLFIGEGYLKTELHKYAERAGVADIVLFAGFRDDIAGVTKVLDVALLISEFEGMGRVILEAMRCRVPVIATAVGGIVDLITDRETGYLIPPNDPDSLAVQVDYCFSHPEELACIADKAYRTVTDTFSADTMARLIQEVYEK